MLDPDRAARMHTAGGNADLGAHADLAAVGELGRRIVQQDRRIEFVEEARHGCGVFRNDCLGMV